MSLDKHQTALCDPTVLSERANLLRGIREGNPFASPIEDDLRQAARRVADDLRLIAQRTAAKAPVEYADILGAHIHEKIASILFLTKYLLLDLSHLPREMLDIELSHARLAQFAETIYRTGAVDGLIFLYSFSQD